MNCLRSINTVSVFRKHVKFNFLNVCLHETLLPTTLFHTSSKRSEDISINPEAEMLRKKYKNPVDWLPFSWHRRKRFNIYEQSGDLVKSNIVDPSTPKPDFELSDELKLSDDYVKQFFSMQTGSVTETKEVCKRNYLKKVQRHPFDFNSIEVKIALLTVQIRALFDHKVKFRRDKRVGGFILTRVILKRYGLLNKLRNMDNDRFEWVLKELQLTFEPPRLANSLPHYCKKWDLRRMTREYCEKQVNDKKAAYHKELKDQQEDFLKEKKEILAWIEQEEKALKEL